MGRPSITQLKDRPIVCPSKSELKTKLKLRKPHNFAEKSVQIHVDSSFPWIRLRKCHV